MFNTHGESKTDVVERRQLENRLKLMDYKCINVTKTLVVMGLKWLIIISNL
jgi:hypothetical protein